MLRVWRDWHGCFAVSDIALSYAEMASGARVSFAAQHFPTHMQTRIDRKFSRHTERLVPALLHGLVCGNMEMTRSGLGWALHADTQKLDGATQ